MPDQALYEKAVVVTRKTVLEELTARFTTVAQSRFYLEHAGQAFEPVQEAHDRYQQVLDSVRGFIPKSLKVQFIDRDYLPQYTFEKSDLIITIGQDGLVVNTAKYLTGQPIIAVNPDPTQFDGVLLPFTNRTIGSGIQSVCAGKAILKQVTMAEAVLQDGQRLLGFNDLFIGARSHISSRYNITLGDKNEDHSSSGIIVSTGAGSTGWLKSVYTGAAGIIHALGGKVVPPPDGGRMPWNTKHLVYSVREPFPSKATQTELIYGLVAPESPLIITSKMPENGVIFSDGVEQDYLPFNSGATATIGLAKEKARLAMC